MVKKRERVQGKESVEKPASPVSKQPLYQAVCCFFSRYILFVIAGFWALYLYLFPDVWYRLWQDLTVYSEDASERITIDKMLQGLLFFMCATYILRHLKTFLNHKLLARLSLDSGTRHTVVTLVGYALWFLIFFISLSIVGINLKNLAIVAGALSVGIGFGLQNIVSNFVSGLVILFERPIKEGDWVIINGQEGFVKTIRIRSTEIETFDKAHVLIPNADILSGNVVNRTHDDLYGRIVVAVNVSYDADMERVRDILLELARADKRLVRDPAPYVWITSFDDSYLKCELRGITANVMNKGSIQSDLMFGILAAFQKEGIRIPMPQRVVHLSAEKEAE